MPQTLDLKDRRILYLLNENARFTTNKIGSILSCSREVVEYRIKKLQKEGIISNFITLINGSRLGFDTYLMLIQLQNFSSESEKQIIEKIKAHPFSKWIAKTTGSWDLQVALAAKDKRHLAQVVDDIALICGNHLRHYDLTINIEFMKVEDLAFLIPEGINYNPKTTMSAGNDFRPDEKDYAIFKHVTNNGKFQLIELAKQIGMSVDATKARLKNLEKHGFILKYQGVIDISKLNRIVYYLFLKFSTFSKKEESRLKEFFTQMKQAAFVERIVGNWDVRIEIIAEDAQEYEQTLTKIREFFSTELKYYHSSLMLKEHKRLSFSDEMVTTED